MNQDNSGISTKENIISIKKILQSHQKFNSQFYTDEIKKQHNIINYIPRDYSNEHIYNNFNELKNDIISNPNDKNKLIGSYARNSSWTTIINHVFSQYNINKDNQINHYY